MRIISCLILFIYFSQSLFPNGDPTTRMSALNRSANPIPRTIVDIQMLREDLLIKPGIFTTVTVKYLLWNSSEKDYIDIDYGFPVDYQGAGDEFINSSLQGDFYSEKDYAIGWHDDYIKDLVFMAKGQVLASIISEEYVIKAGNIQEAKEILMEVDPDFSEEDLKDLVNQTHIGRKWFYTQFSIKAGEVFELEVRYTLRNSNTNSLNFLTIGNYGDIPRGISSLYYDLSPAAHWGNGKAKEFYVEIDTSEMHGSSDPENNKHAVSGLPFNRQGDKLIYKTRNFNFNNAEPIVFNYINNPSDAFIEWIKHRIPNNKFTVEASDEIGNYPVSNLIDMDLETAWATKYEPDKEYIITIRFNEPTKIGSILILGGYHKSKETFTNNYRPQNLLVSLDKDSSSETINLALGRDEEYKEVTFRNFLEHSFHFSPYDYNQVSQVSFKITDVFPGEKYNDICISEIIILGRDIIPRIDYAE